MAERNTELTEQKRAYARELAESDPDITGQGIHDQIKKHFKSGMGKLDLYSIVREVRGLEKIQRKDAKRKLPAKRGPYKKKTAITDHHIMTLTKGPDVSPALIALVKSIRDVMAEQNIAKLMISTGSSTVQIARIVTEEVTL